MDSSKDKLETATFGEGCYWCSEPLFSELKGVKSVTVGFSGGKTQNPTYEQVCTGSTGHTEVSQIEFDSEIIRFEELLKVFWKTHDPTTLNRQGNDIGVQYRSVIFYHNEVQKEAAEKYKSKLEAEGAFDAPIVTAIEAFKAFYPAKDYHQSYFEKNSHNPYCQLVVKPKKDKFEKAFKDFLK